MVGSFLKLVFVLRLPLTGGLAVGAFGLGVVFQFQCAPQPFVSVLRCG